MKVLEELRTLRKKWDKITSGGFGYIIYAVLGIFSAYAFYFGSGILLQTDLPFVAVVSGSMDHGVNEQGPPCKQFAGYEESFDNWWNLCGDFYKDLGISKETFSKFPFRDGFKKGDMPIVQGNNYKIGDVIVYTVETERAPIIHRIVKLNDNGTYQTRGDHNSAQNSYERSVKSEQIHGRVIFILPKVGYLKVILTEIFGV